MDGEIRNAFSRRLTWIFAARTLSYSAIVLSGWLAETQTYGPRLARSSGDASAHRSRGKHATIFPVSESTYFATSSSPIRKIRSSEASYAARFMKFAVSGESHRRAPGTARYARACIE